jgi:DNA polymerase/3'-5' exonuclease PolX
MGKKDILYKYMYGKRDSSLKESSKSLLCGELYDMGYRTRQDLLRHINSKKLPKLPNTSIIQIKYSPKKCIKNAEALKVIKSLKLVFKKIKIIPVGSIRREEKTHSDIDILLIAPPTQCAPDFSRNNLTLVEGKSRHQKYIFTLNKTNYLIDVFICTKKELPYMLFHYTGSKQYNIRTRAYVKKKGLLLNQYGLWKNKKLVYLNIKSEKDLIRKIGISYREPTNRQK